MPRPLLTLLGTTGTAVGCAAMAASLPTGIAGVLASLGISGSGLFAHTLGSAARPLFIASAILLIAGALACSRLVATLAIVGGLLLYLSMFELAHGGGGDSDSMSMTAMNHAHGTARADSISFYAGLGALLLSITLQIWRRRRVAAVRFFGSGARADHRSVGWVSCLGDLVEAAGDGRDSRPSWRQSAGGRREPMEELLRLCAYELILRSCATICSSFFELRRALA
jgi:hypothetical protein